MASPATRPLDRSGSWRPSPAPGPEPAPPPAATPTAPHPAAGTPPTGGQPGQPGQPGHQPGGRPAANETNFSPSKAQLQLLEALQNHEDAATLSEFCEQNGVSRASFYRWQRDPDFCRWLAAAVATHLHGSGAILVVTAMNAALSGDPRMQMAMLKFTLNPNGLAAIETYLGRLPAGPALAPEHAAEPAEPEPRPQADAPALPPPAGAISATYRLLKQARRVTQSDFFTARRAAQFAGYMEKLKKYADLEQQWQAELAAPPAPPQPAAAHPREPRPAAPAPPRTPAAPASVAAPLIPASNNPRVPTVRPASFAPA